MTIRLASTAAVVTLCLSAPPAAAGFLVAQAVGEHIVAIDTETGEVVSTYTMPTTVGESAQSIATDGTRYFVTDADDGSLWSITDSFYGAERIGDLPAATPKGMTMFDGELWLIGQASVGDDRLHVLDPTTAAELRSYVIPAEVNLTADLTSDGEHLWGVDVAARKLWRIQPSDGSLDLSFDLPASGTVFALAFDPDTDQLWFFRNGALAAFTIDRTTGDYTEAFSLAGEDFAFLFSAVYRSEVVPTRTASWSALKGAYGGR